MSTKFRVSSALLSALGGAALLLILDARARVVSAAEPAPKPSAPFDGEISRNAKEMLEQGRETVKYTR